MIFISFMVIVGFIVLGMGISLTLALRDRRILTLKEDNDKLSTLAYERGKSLIEAHRALRSISNGAGNPQIEAQIVLDDYNRKEIL